MFTCGAREPCSRIFTSTRSTWSILDSLLFRFSQEQERKRSGNDEPGNAYPQGNDYAIHRYLPMKKDSKKMYDRDNRKHNNSNSCKRFHDFSLLSSAKKAGCKVSGTMCLVLSIHVVCGAIIVFWRTSCFFRCSLGGRTRNIALYHRCDWVANGSCRRPSFRSAFCRRLCNEIFSSVLIQPCSTSWSYKSVCSRTLLLFLHLRFQ